MVLWPWFVLLLALVAILTFILIFLADTNCPIKVISLHNSKSKQELELEPCNQVSNNPQIPPFVKKSEVTNSNPLESTENFHSNTLEIEKRAMDLVINYEKANGGDIENVSMYFTGYDLKSTRLTEFRAIETACICLG